MCVSALFNFLIWFYYVSAFFVKKIKRFNLG